MGHVVKRGGRLSREPHLFLSHSSRDKSFVRKLADDLTFCGVDAWLDEWEIRPGDSIYDHVTEALEKSSYVGIVLGDNFADSQYASDEMKQALSRERKLNQTIVLPLLCGAVKIPAFLEDKLCLDFRSDYYSALVKLAGLIHGVTNLRIEEALRIRVPGSLTESFRTLQYAGCSAPVILGEDDYREILEDNAEVLPEGEITFFPEHVLRRKNISPRIRTLMQRILAEDLTD